MMDNMLLNNAEKIRETQGILESVHEKFMNNIKYVKVGDQYIGFQTYENIINFILELRKYEFDAHITIAGQNGVGKTMLALALAKRMDKDIFQKNNIIYAFHSYSHFIDKLTKQKDCVVVCDELGKFFNYKSSMTSTQIALFNTIEIARANRIALIGCCRDARRLNNNYRNGKVQIIIWVIDRFFPNPYWVSYAMVFLANPVLEHEDKFGFDLAFYNARSIEDMRVIGENLDTFAGYLLIGNVLLDITPEELKQYQENKIKQMIVQSEKYKKKIREKDIEVEQTLLEDSIENLIGGDEFKEKGISSNEISD